MTFRESLSDVDLRTTSIRGGRALFLGQIFRFGLSFGSQILLARLLLPSDFGLVAMVSPIAGFISVFADLGLLQAIIQKPQITSNQLNTIFWINTSASVLFALFFSGTAPFLAWVYHDSRVVQISLALSCLLVIGGVTQVQGALLNRQLLFIRMAIVDIVALIVGVTVGIAGAFGGLGYWALVLNQIAFSVSYSILLWAMSDWRPSRPSANADIVSILKFGAHVTGANLVGYLNTSVDNMMIGVVLGPEKLGVYDRAWKLAAQPLSQLTAPVNRLAIPILSRLNADPERYSSVFTQMIQMLLLLSTPGLLFSVMLAHPLVLFLFGAKWQASAPVFMWVGIGAIISPVNIGVFWLFVSQGRVKEQVKYTIIVSLVNIFAYAVGLQWGLTGVAAASAISVYLLQCPILLIAATRKGPVGLLAILRSILPIIVSVIIAAVVLGILKTLFSNWSIISLSICLMTSYLATGVALTCSFSGRQVLNRAFSLMKIRTFENRSASMIVSTTD